MVRTAGQAKLIEPVSFGGVKRIYSDIHEVHKTETERSQQSLEGCSASLDENGRGVEGNDVNYSKKYVRTLYDNQRLKRDALTTAHLLTNHNDK